jgi:hypothetical protein
MTIHTAHHTNTEVETIDPSPLPKRSRRRRSTLVRTFLAVIAALVLTTTTAGSASAGTYYWKDSDVVKQNENYTQIWGNVKFASDSSNENNRYAEIRVGVQQAWRGTPWCIGVKVMALTDRVQHTYGGSVGGGWSVTGPSVSGSASYSRTTLKGRDSDGIYWKCPPRNRSIRNYVNVNDYWNARTDGVLKSIAVKGCVTDDPANPNRRWCTPWDVNDFGGR